MNIQQANEIVAKARLESAIHLYKSIARKEIELRAENERLNQLVRSLSNDQLAAYYTNTSAVDNS